MSQSSDPLWDERAQKTFFDSLKEKSPDEQGEFILAKTEELIIQSDSQDGDLLKGAESLMNLFTLKYRSDENEERAHALLASIYIKLGETEKASRFLK